MIVPFHEVVARYPVVFFDAYGVLKNSGGVIDGVHALLAGLRAAGKDIYVVTNDASRSPHEMALIYAHPEYGELLPPGKNISSGLLASDFLKAKFSHGRVAYLGRPGSRFYIEIAGLEPVPLVDCNPDDEQLQALMLLDDEGFDWFSDINRAINLVRRRNLPVVVANSDATYPVNDSEVAVAVGSLATMMETIVQRHFIRFGKPDALMFAYAFHRAAAARGNTLEKHDILVVGDTLTTDIVGANTFGLDTALVLSGNTLPQHVTMRIESTGIIPTYVCESIFT